MKAHARTVHDPHEQEAFLGLTYGQSEGQLR